MRPHKTDTGMSCVARASAFKTTNRSMARGRAARKVPRRTNPRTPPRPRRCANLRFCPRDRRCAPTSGVACAISPGNPSSPAPELPSAHRRRQHRLNRAPTVSGPRNMPRNIAFSGTRMTPLETLSQSTGTVRGVLDLVRDFTVRRAISRLLPAATSLLLLLLAARDGWLGCPAADTWLWCLFRDGAACTLGRRAWKSERRGHAGALWQLPERGPAADRQRPACRTNRQPDGTARW